MEPDLRDSQMGKVYHGSYLEQEPVWMNAYLEVSFTVTGSPRNNVYLTVSQDAERTLAYFESLGLHPQMEEREEKWG